MTREEAIQALNSLLDSPMVSKKLKNNQMIEKVFLSQLLLI